MENNFGMALSIIFPKYHRFAECSTYVCYD